jgi:glycine cleavage system T protein (aminomethyltransferase)
VTQPVATVERTPLFEEHLRLGAQMTNFGGWSMPLQYSSIREEHQAVRTAAGLFDLSHMGEIEVSGTDAVAQLERLLTNEVATLNPGRARYALLCNEQGGILDDLLVYNLSPGYLLVVNAGNQDKDFEWVAAHAPAGVARNTGRQTALIGVQGPRAPALVQRLADRDLKNVKYYAFVDGSVAGVRCRVSRTGYTGEDGFELFCQPSDALRLWQRLLDAGGEVGLKPAGLGARDTLRLEAGMRLYGNDLDEQTNPLEAGLDWAVKLDKEFIGRDAIARAAQQGLSRVTVGLRMRDRSIPRHGYPVLHEGRPVGTVSSGNVSFTLGYNIALAFVAPALSQVGTSLAVDVRGTAAPADVVALPFYRRPHP